VSAPFDRALRDAIADVAASVPGADLSRAVETLSRRYRDGATLAGGGATASVGRLTEAERLAYVVVRLPATAAALDAAFDAVARHTLVAPRTLTDLGAGPGTVLWPAVSRWPGIRRVTLVDREATSLDERLDRCERLAYASGAEVGPFTRLVVTPEDLA